MTRFDPGANGEQQVADGCINFDKVATVYDTSRVIPDEALMKAARLLQQVSGIKPDQTILDAGVGTGRFALPLAQLGLRVLGIDVSDQMLRRLQIKRDRIEQSRDVMKLRLMRGDLRSIPLRSGAVSAMFMVHILHLISDWRQVLDEAQRLLSPGGRLLLARENGGKVPTRDHYFSLARERGLLRFQIGADTTEAIEYLEGAGAEINEVDTSEIRWTQSTPVARTLAQLEARVWSSMWSLSDTDHNEVMALTRQWARERYRGDQGVDPVETAEGSLYMVSARFS